MPVFDVGSIPAAPAAYESVNIKNLREAKRGRGEAAAGALHIHAARRADYELF